jgi:hypothetical protein
MRRRLDGTMRSLLVVATIAAYGYWGWAAHDGWTRLVWSVGSMIVAATVWDSLRVRGDGATPTVAVPGWARLMVEAAYFTGAVTSVAAAGLPVLGFIYLLLIGIHYASTHERLIWLLHEGEGSG